MINDSQCPPGAGILLHHPMVLTYLYLVRPTGLLLIEFMSPLVMLFTCYVLRQIRGDSHTFVGNCSVLWWQQQERNLISLYVTLLYSYQYRLVLM